MAEREENIRKPIPPNADYYNWDGFCRFADKKGIGKKSDDFMPWWEVWKAGYIAAMNS